jgi:hypothetical protein
MVKENDTEKKRRATERLPLAAMVSYHINGQEYGNLAADISPDGIFIRTFIPPPVGSRLEITLHLPEEIGGFRVDVEGEVVRVVNNDEDPRNNGMGIQFIAIHVVEPATIRYLVTRIFNYDSLQRILADDAEN